MSIDVSKYSLFVDTHQYHLNEAHQYLLNEVILMYNIAIVQNTVRMSVIISEWHFGIIACTGLCKMHKFTHLFCRTFVRPLNIHLDIWDILAKI